MGGMSYRPTLHEIELVQEWNAAIEAAAKQVRQRMEKEHSNDTYGVIIERNLAREDCAEAILALKKEG